MRKAGASETRRNGPSVGFSNRFVVLAWSERPLVSKLDGSLERREEKIKKTQKWYHFNVHSA